MKEDISSLLEFFEKCGPEVQGHTQNKLDAHRVALIERFIAGRCDERERRELSEFLQLHPAWIRWIVDRLELAREVGGPAANSSATEKKMSA